MEILLLLALGILALLSSLFMRKKQLFQQTDGEMAKANISRGTWKKFVPILFLAIGCSLIAWLLLHYGKNVTIASLQSQSTLLRTGIVFALIMLLSSFDLREWHGTSDRSRYFFAVVVGTIASFFIIALKRAFFETSVGDDPFLLAFGMILLLIGWRFLFGSWQVSVKMTVLGTFLFWVLYAIIRYKTQQELLAVGIAAATAIIPVLVWCALFLQYHAERRSIIFLAFFAGMLSTVPILFLHELSVRSMTLNFFLFTITPINFQLSSEAFVRESIFKDASGTSSILLSTLVTYLWVGIIEEVSKFWVLKKSGRLFFRSIDDAIQLSIIVAIGFAFAENLANPNYFIGFVQRYLLNPATPDWGAFIGNIFGRSVLTMMVHILSTGVLGYFFGLAVFSSSILRDQFAQGKTHAILDFFHRILSIDTAHIYRTTMMGIGLCSSIILHGMFDFIVTLPEVIPGNPTTIGALLQLSPASTLQAVPITLLPSLLYVIGGFWLLSYLFERTENAKEFGQVSEAEIILE